MLLRFVVMPGGDRVTKRKSRVFVTFVPGCDYFINCSRTLREPLDIMSTFLALRGCIPLFSSASAFDAWGFPHHQEVLIRTTPLYHFGY